MSNTTDTPETEKTQKDYLKSLWERGSKVNGGLIPADFARKLERERDEARRVATAYADAYGGAFDLPWETKTKNDQ